MREGVEAACPNRCSVRSSYELPVTNGPLGSRSRRSPPRCRAPPLLVAGLVVVSVMLYRSRRAVPVALGAPSPSLNAQAILAERLARGEVSVEDFSAARGALRGDSRPAVGLKDV